MSRPCDLRADVALAFLVAGPDAGQSVHGRQIGTGCGLDDVGGHAAARHFHAVGFELDDHITEGIDPERFKRLSGRALDARQISSLSADGFIVANEAGRVRVTPLGFPVLDSVVADLAA